MARSVDRTVADWSDEYDNPGRGPAWCGRPRKLSPREDAMERSLKWCQLGLIAWLSLGRLGITCEADDEPVTPQIMIDQFGWRPGSVKVAIFAEPVKGQNAGSPYRPGLAFEIV